MARALVNNPGLILADEPTGSLDSRRGMEILSLLAELCHERRAAVLLATHDLQAAEITDRLYTLRDGRLVQESSRRGLLEAVSGSPVAG